MRHLALASLCLALLGCADRDPFVAAPSNGPVNDSENMRRVMGESVADAPLTPEPGDIWADLSHAKLQAALAEPDQRTLLQTASTAAESPRPTAPGPRYISVQLTAAGSATAARTEWQHLEQRMPQLIGGRVPAVMQAELDGRSLWRLRTGGFASTDEANAFCARVLAEHEKCWVVAGAS